MSIKHAPTELCRSFLSELWSLPVGFPSLSIASEDSRHVKPKHSNRGERPTSERCAYPERLSSRKRVIRSRLAAKLEYCFSHTSLNLASTLRLIVS